MTGKEERNGKSAWDTLWEYAKSILIALILALFVRAFIVQAFKIPSGSMIPTLLVGDHILVSKFAYDVKVPFFDTVIWHRADPKRKDVVVFKYPLDPSKDFIKRVIGLPGDKILIRNKKVYINDKLLVEPYVQHTDPRVFPADASPRDNLGPLRVPPHSLFVMGDNRDESYDSRFWKFVDYSALKGKAFIIYWSWNGKGSMNPNPDKFFIRWNRIGKLIR
ncbi:signal peptidase I . Serine peptidase. MEROPS family S26A [Thermodesulforhabdus norvegica]|uniref:Signal peptidase I n=1 Tax=Thermodesulforhabdus norvegica TaxID=39841 RepID=A0A1I4WCX6_9BACT|nr:signal peptidase I [Thermodesulforhabdus norvegica]SFN11182.1 signal peptidase I . Serine peptidase. MEROPS family S26A [Thermodesulforhabdus norvegica]